MGAPSDHFIDGNWLIGEGSELTSTDPATGVINWSGHAATGREIGLAVEAARAAFEGWADLSLAAKIAHLQAIAGQYTVRKAELSDAISRETGKPRWEANSEVDVMIAKVAISIEAFEKRSATSTSVSGGVTSATRYRPHGVVAVLGPFNMPGHLPNGHLIPALLASNTIVFKPSESTPLVGQFMAEAIAAANLPAGVFNLLQGAGQTGKELAAHPGIDGLFFTGSAAVGTALNRAFADQPGKILALEMGGNNPLILHDCSDMDAAIYTTIQSAFVTAGQRCSCARRLIVVDGAQNDTFLARLVDWINRIRIGFYTDSLEPFLGPVISARAASALLKAQAELVQRGGQILVEMQASDRSPALLSPGLIDVTHVANRPDRELFGPLLQVVRVPDFEAALLEANQTRYGLSAGLLSDRKDVYDRFYRSIRAGVVNWNRPLTGASSRLPFGGVGLSGNQRPSAFFATDYCSYPVGSMESDRPSLPAQLPPGLLP